MEEEKFIEESCAVTLERLPGGYVCFDIKMFQTLVHRYIPYLYNLTKTC